MQTLLLLREVYDGIVAHACSVFPEEAVGLLGAKREGEIAKHAPLENIADNRRRRFLAHPYSQYLAETRLKAHGFQIAGVYHSHPGGRIGLSDEDMAWARLREGYQVVVAPRNSQDVEAPIGAFYIGPGSVAEVRVRIDG